MQFELKRNVRIICDLEIGDKVMLNNWGPKLDFKEWTIVDIKLDLQYESKIAVKINNDHYGYLDAGWFIKQ